MIGNFGESLVMDWGLAKTIGRPQDIAAMVTTEETLIPQSGSGGATMMGSAVGTPAYMSPEQAAGRWDIIDHATDIYGLGGVLYALMTGSPPLVDGNWPEMQQHIQRGDFPRPREKNPRIAKTLEAICLKAMAPAPKDRYASASVLATDIERWLGDEPLVAVPDRFVAGARRWLRRHRRAVTAAFSVLIMALAMAAAGLVLLDQKNRQILRNEMRHKPRRKSQRQSPLFSPTICWDKPTPTCMPAINK